MRSSQLTRLISRVLLIATVGLTFFWLFWESTADERDSAIDPSAPGALQVRDVYESLSQFGTSAALEGWVKDEVTSAAVPGAHISLHGELLAVADAAGYFAVPESLLLARTGGENDLTLEIQATGYSDWMIRNARYREDDTLRIHAKLAPTISSPVLVDNASNRVSSALGYSVSFVPSYRQPYSVVGVSALNSLTPPATIRIYRTRTGTVEVVPFRDYVKHVLPHEWIPSWSPEALKAGAMASKTYAWYWVQRGGKQGALGADLKDNVEDQVYDPNVSYASTDAAVDATFNFAMTRNGGLFQAQYCAGSYRADPSGDCPWPGPYMTQWGSSYHADQGKSWGWILGFYYGATIAPNPPGGVYNGQPPVAASPAPASSQPTEQIPTSSTSYVVGQGSNRAEVFQAAYVRNGGEQLLGKPVGPVRWWIQSLSESNVLSQRFSGPRGANDVWLVFNILRSDRNPSETAFLLAGEIGAAYASHQPPGPEWIGAPASDRYIGLDGLPSQGFASGTLKQNGNNVTFSPWPTEFVGWKAEYYATFPRPESPLREIAAHPALIRNVDYPKFAWPAAQGGAESRGLGRGPWAVSYTKNMLFDGSATVLTLVATGPALLWVDGTLVVNGLGWTGTGSGSYTSQLTAGLHSVRIQYFNEGVDAALELKLETAGAQPTPLPGILPTGSSARLALSVQWLGGERAPHASWARPVTLYLSDVTTHERILAVQGRTSENGTASFEGLPVGMFNVHLKGPHSLQSAVGNIELKSSSTTSIDMRAQIEGDLDGDNCVTIDDLMRVQAMLGAHAGVAGFDPGADLDGDGMVTMQDMSLLRSGFDMCGDIPAVGSDGFQAMSAPGAPSLSQHLATWTAPAALRRDLALNIVSSSAAAQVGETVELRVLAQTGSQPVDGASFILRYDPRRLQPLNSAGSPIENAEPGLLLPAVMGSWIDPTGGAIGFSSAILQGTPPQGEFILALVRFRVLPGPGGPTRIEFAPISSGYMQLTNGGMNLLAVANSMSLSLLP